MINPKKLYINGVRFKKTINDLWRRSVWRRGILLKPGTTIAKRSDSAKIDHILLYNVGIFKKYIMFINELLFFH